MFVLYYPARARESGEGVFAVTGYSSHHALLSASVYSCSCGPRCMLGVVVCVLAQTWPFAAVWKWEGWPAFRDRGRRLEQRKLHVSVRENLLTMRGADTGTRSACGFLQPCAR